LLWTIAFSRRFAPVPDLSGNCSSVPCLKESMPPDHCLTQSIDKNIFTNPRSEDERNSGSFTL
jgi:hypothetical protein